MYQELSENHEKKENVPRKEKSVANYYIAMAVDIVLLYVLNNLRYMNISLITDNFTFCLWAINLALGIGIIGNFILLLYRPLWFHNTVQVILSALAILGVYVVFKTFPFDLGSEIWETVAKAILILIMAGIAITFVLDLFRKEEKDRTPNNGPDQMSP